MTSLDLERRIKSGEILTREEVLAVWEDVRQGVRRRFPDGFLHIEEHSCWIIGDFVSGFTASNDGRYPGMREFRAAKLQGMLTMGCQNTPYYAFVAAGFTSQNNPNYDACLDETPWLVVDKLPKHYFKDAEKRKEAISWLVEIVTGAGRPATSINYKDFYRYGLHNLLFYCGSSPYRALEEAGHVILPTDMNTVTKGYWTKLKNRSSYVSGLARQLGRPPKYEELPYALVKAAGSTNAALVEAGLLNKDEQK